MAIGCCNPNRGGRVFFPWNCWISFGFEQDFDHFRMARIKQTKHILDPPLPVKAVPLTHREDQKKLRFAPGLGKNLVLQ